MHLCQTLVIFFTVVLAVNDLTAGVKIVTHPLHVSSGWNLLSLPVDVQNGASAVLFPSSVSPSYVFHHLAGYVAEDTLRNGKGFWLKFIVADTVVIEGELVSTDTVEVQAGWNIVGGLSMPIAVSGILTDPPGIITSQFFGFTPGLGYHQETVLQPGQGFWVKISEGGVLILSSHSGQPCPGLQTVTYEGKTYNTVQIGNQCWLRENLDIGTMVPGSLNQVNNSTIEKYCYDDNPANCVTYGGLYSWDEAMEYVSTAGARGICPPGWHVPTSAAFETLGAAVGGDGNALKAIGQGSGGGAGTNTSGFSALLAGFRGITGTFSWLTHGGFFWSSSQADGLNAVNSYSFSYSSVFDLSNNSRNSGFGVRCLKDNPPPDSPLNISPPDGSPGQSRSVVLAWSCADPEGDPLTYDLYFSHANPPDTMVSMNQRDTILAITGLDPGTGYYWRVVAKDDHANVTPGPVWSFTTNAPPSAPSNPIPTDGATGEALLPTLRWTSSDPDGDALTFTIYLGTSNPPDSLVSSGQMDTSRSLVGLVGATTYFWRVVAFDSHGDSAVGPVWAFTTNSAPSMPSNPTPADSATGQGPLTSLRWSSSDSDGDAMTFGIYFGTSNPPDSLLASGLVDTTYALGGLVGATTYFWRVMAVDTHGDSAMGPVWSFMTASLGFPCPGISSVDYAGMTYHTVQIGNQCWLRENLNVGTHLHGSLNPSNNGVIEKYCYNNDTNYCVTYGGLYSWNEMMQYVTTPGSQGICPTGWRIPTLSDLQTLIANVGGDGNILKRQDQGSGSGLGTNTSAFSALLGGHRGLAGPGTFVFLGLYGNYWSSTESSTGGADRLYLESTSALLGSGPDHKENGFSIRCLHGDRENLPPAVPSGPSPGDGSIGQPMSPALRWSCSDPDTDPLSYDIYLETTNPPGTLVGSNQSDTTVATSDLAGGTTYYWKVVAKDGHGHSTVGPVWSFSTTDMGFPCPGTPTVYYEGKTYNTVRIGVQCWLEENLDVGTMIPGSQGQINNSLIEKYCYNDDTANCSTFGALYQWNEAMRYSTSAGAQGICPPGWHLPTVDEFFTLSVTVGGDGNALKAVGQGFGSGAGTNTSGFAGLLAGARGGNQFYDLNRNNTIWSSSQYATSRAFGMPLHFGDANINPYHEVHDYAFSIRCVMD